VTDAAIHRLSGGEKVEFDSLKVDDLSELKDICGDEKSPEWISNCARHACLSCYARLHTVEKACNLGGNTPKVFHQNTILELLPLRLRSGLGVFPVPEQFQSLTLYDCFCSRLLS
jgi:hypothetical protein